MGSFDLTKPKALVCDLGNVLFYFDRQKTYKALSRFCYKPPDEVQAIIESTDIRERYELGQFTDTEFYATVLEMLELTDNDLPFDDFSQVWGNIFTANYSLFETLALLRNQLTLVMLSNTNNLHYLNIRKSYGNIMSFFFSDRKVLSYVEGIAKPDERIFHIARHKAQADFSECVYVDDIIEYVTTAQSLGMRGIVYDSNDKFINRVIEMGLVIPR
ncbi:MAG: hypothetical protein RBU23_07485 [Candidatus Auribacterota bacterium]|jgi:putative hydrolase of the HAD superfamily|nr:hypothetical protein [Candidatus Auribacterota bacterium]